MAKIVDMEKELEKRKNIEVDKLIIEALTIAMQHFTLIGNNTKAQKLMQILTAWEEEEQDAT